jgi:formylglycine-generating enzyme required for sulfatase activity
MKIFISYRRDDSADIAGRIQDFLVTPVGPFTLEDVFKDDAIPLGVRFPKYLEQTLAKCAVCLVVIGPQWATITDENGARRLDNPGDFVRLEVETAIKREMPIIPLLVMGARMPRAVELPASMVDLLEFNGQSLRRDPDFRGDMARLVGALQTLLKAPTVPSKPEVARLPTSLELMPKPFGWCPVTAGKVTLGGNDGANGGYITKATRFDVAAFSIGKYPVTNGQFAKFVDGDGYTNRAWWTDAGWEAKLKGWKWVGNEYVETKTPWAAPRYWTDPKWNKADHPVVGVSWYEAVAFCKWLAGQTGEDIRLPTEQEWQRAVQGATRRAYPYGDKFDKAKCNFSTQGTTPVTQYEGKGDSLFGVMDMSGNVWEWCATDYETGAQDINLNTNSRVLRGGSWRDYYTDFLRADFRYGGNPHFGYDDWGFRLARS